MMESLVRKYLDGELSEKEAQEFLEALADDPALSREVAALEEVVALGSERQEITVSPQFADGVMAAVDSVSRPVASPGMPGRNWARSLPLAASWMLAIGLGYVLATGVPGRGAMEGAATGTAAQVVQADVRSPRIARLVYATAGREVGQVGVAGSFNDWNPARTPMRLENGIWVAVLMLPPDSYEYMFVEDNTTWVTDPLAHATRDDGFGSRNAVLDIEL